jgi:TRAP-type C4-dicarboxylate transport system substrate-binding protein
MRDLRRFFSGRVERAQRRERQFGMAHRYAPRPATLALLVTLFALSCAVRAQGAGDPASGWKLSVAVGPAFALGKAADRWAKLVAERSGGKLVVRAFPGATLSGRDPAREFNALREGAADLAVGSTLYWSAQVVELNLIGLPWLAPEDNDLKAIAEGAVGEQLLAAVEGAGAVPLAIAVLGHRALATSKPVHSPADIAGLTVRATSTPLLTDLFVGLGAAPRAMSAVDAQPAFRAHTLEAQEGAPATLAAARLEAFGVKHVIEWGAIAECAIFAANKNAWMSWTPAQQIIVRDAAVQAASELRSLVQAENEAALRELAQRGVTVTRLTATGRAAFAAAARGVYDKWATTAGPDLVRRAEAAVRNGR